MRLIDRSSLTTAFVAAVATRLGERLRPEDLSELEALTADLLEHLRIRSKPSPRLVTVLLADLRGFSVISEAYPATVIIDILNRYFSRMCEIIHAHGGSIDKFMGDSVMALFGAPGEHDNDLQQAVCCAARMQQAMVDINREHRAQDLPEIFAGIGLNTGNVMAGSFGSQLHYEYTVIGDEVNLAARIEAYSLRGQILLSEKCYEQASDYIEVGSVNRVQVKGRDAPVNLYELAAVTRPDRIEVPRVEVRKSPRVQVDLPLHYHLVDNKALSAETLHGAVLDLGYNGMLALLDRELPPFQEIAFTLTHQLTSRETSTLYAKVLRSRRAGAGFQTNLEFTSTGTPGYDAVKQYVDQLLWGH